MIDRTSRWRSRTPASLLATAFYPSVWTALGMLVFSRAAIRNDWADGLIAVMLGPAWLVAGLALIPFAGFFWRRAFVTALMVLGGFAATAVTCIVVNHITEARRINRMPLESELVERFASQRSEFEALAARIEALDLRGGILDARSTGDGTEHRDEIDAVVALGAVYATNRDDTIRFAVYVWGLSIGGEAAGYLRAAEPPENLVENVEAFATAAEGDFEVFRALGGGWYLYRERW